MPQIWVSYEELGDYLGCGGPAAAEHAAASRWPRRRCSDGLTRAKLPAEEALNFLKYYLAPEKHDHQTDSLVSTLQSLLRVAFGETHPHVWSREKTKKPAGR
jgi:hypothetical protein